MKLVPIEQLSDENWAQAHDTMYDPDLAAHMGSDPALLQKPTLQEFYCNIMNAVEDGKFRAWALIASDGSYQGHAVLDKSSGEWEMGAVLKDPALWSRGYGVKAALHAMRWAFEEDHADWVIAFTHGKDPRVYDIVARGGFRPFMHFWAMPKEVWADKWARRMERLTWA